MSDTFTATEAPATEEVADTSVVTEAVPVEPEAPAGPVLDPTQYADHLVPVTVDGETTMVPFEEARAGYSRQADYTRKTQALAAEREQLGRAQAIATALAQDPAETIRVLAEVYDVSLDQAAGIAADALGESEAVSVDPFQQRLDAMEARFRAQDEERALAAMQQELDAAVQQFGVDPDAVVNRAIEIGTANLAFVAQALAYEATAAAQAQASAGAEQTQAKVDAKRAASPVHGGGTNPAASVGAPAITSYDDAARAALLQHGITPSF